jgi:hypothetical protein
MTKLVSKALQNNWWISYIVGSLSVQALSQFISLWVRLQ